MRVTRHGPVAVFLLLAVVCAAPAVAAKSKESASYPSAGLVDDALIDFRVRAALLQAIGNDGLDVTIATTDRVVSLTGTVANADLLARAEVAATSIRGVKAVDSALRIVAPAPPEAGPAHPGRPPHAAEDALLEARVKARLLEALGVRALRLSIEADQGTINVAGSIPTKDERDLAINVVGQVLGVEFVKDILHVDRSLKKVLVETAENRTTLRSGS